MDKNPNGVFSTTLKFEGKYIPSIADFQLIQEFLDYRYFAKNELDHINWREKFPRLKLWHDEILFSENEHLRGVQ